MSIGNRIKIIRKRKGLTQQELAEGLGVSRASANSLERAEDSITVGRLKRVCKVLDCSLNDLIVEDNAKLEVGQILPMGVAVDDVTPIPGELSKFYQGLIEIIHERNKSYFTNKTTDLVSKAHIKSIEVKKAQLDKLPQPKKPEEVAEYCMDYTIDFTKVFKETLLELMNDAY